MPAIRVAEWVWNGVAPLPVAIVYLNDHSRLANMNRKKDLSLRETADATRQASAAPAQGTSEWNRAGFATRMTDPPCYPKLSSNAGTCSQPGLLDIVHSPMF